MRWTTGRLAVCLLLFSRLAWADSPATQPSGFGELIRSKAEMIGYGAETARLVNEPDEIVSILRNGATVIVKRIPSPVVAVRGYCQTGGVFEGKWLGGGLSHLLEHLVAGGSSDRRTEAENKALLQRIGNDSNAYTTTDHTCYFVNTTVPHMEEAVDLVTGWMLGAKITVPEYRREYQVVQRELERDKGLPDYVFWDMYVANRYRVSPMRVPTIGYQEVIQGLSRDDVFSYYQLAYQPNNMIFAVVGDIDPETMLEAVRKNVSDSKPGRVFSHDIPAEPPVLAPRTMVATFPRLGPAHVDLAFPTVRETSPDMYPLDPLATIVGGGESSTLVQQLRDEQQLVTSISCDDDTPNFVDGSFQVDFQCDAAKVKPTISATLAVLADIRAHGVDAQSLERAKMQMRITHLRSMQTSQDVAANLATDFMETGDVHFSDHYVDQIAAVSASDIQRVAAKYIDPGKLITTVMLPAEAVSSGGLPEAVDLIRPVAPGGASETTSQSAGATQLTQRFVLDNGTVLLVKRFTTTPLVTVKMFTLGGVTDEDASTNGLGNLTMAMLPRGTTSRSAKEIAEYFDSIGGSITCSGGNNTFQWDMSCTKDDLPKAMDVFADVVLHPAFKDDQLNGMKQRILAGISAQDSDWHSLAYRFFKQKFYGPTGSPYQFIPIGTAKTVASFTASQLRDWYDSKALNGPRVVAVYGDVDADTVHALAQKLLGGGQKLGERPLYVMATASGGDEDTTASINVTEVDVQKTELPLAGIFIGYRSGSIIGDPGQYTATRAYTLAGGFRYPTGYIFETLRGLGLVYEAAIFDVPGQSSKIPGCMLSYAGCEPRNVNEVIRQMLLNTARLQGSAEDIQPDWFHRSQELITTGDALDRETPDQQAETAALDELFGLGFNFHDQFAPGINAVTLADVQTYARSRLRDCVVTICTPNPELVNIAAGVRQYTSFPPVNLTPKGVQLDTGAPR
jgi:zinc protease